VALPPEVRVLSQSPIYRTAPWGYRDQPDFLNQVVGGVTGLEPLALLAHLKGIERALGRRTTFRYGPRVIDLDLLLYDDLVLTVPGLSIPHPHLHERAFVLVPLVDLAPELRHPSLDKTMRELLAQVETAGVERYRPEIRRGGGPQGSGPP